MDALVHGTNHAISSWIFLRLLGVIYGVAFLSLVVQITGLIGEHGILHFYNVHLGTALLERRDQAQRLATAVHDRRVVGPKIVLGDFNEWARGMARDILAERLQSIESYRLWELTLHNVLGARADVDGRPRARSLRQA